MEKSTVYFTDFRCPVGTSQLDKLKKLCVTAGIKDIDMDGKFVAIKMHFGELGNLAFLRPNYAKAVADLFGVKVGKVYTMIVIGRYRRQGLNGGYTADWKKAIVTLTEDSKSIEFFDSMM